MPNSLEPNWNLSHLLNWQMILAFVLLAIGHHMDWMYQASLHGWSCYVDLTSRATHLAWYLDWIPRDLWHIAQSIRNFTWFAGPIAGMMGLGVAYGKGWAWTVNKNLVPKAHYIGLYNNMLRLAYLAWNVSILWIFNLVARGAGFSFFANAYKWGWF